ncbi:MAG: hypothetical protein MJE66_15050, partial [Proteobacteria bacterium]|nr:hypothetical protein [Pseudomonadota bacterium]
MLLAVLLPAGIGCVGSGSPLILPQKARLGDTVTMAINSNYLPTFVAGKERFHLTKDNVTVELRETAAIGSVGALVDTTTMRMVFESSLPPGNQLVGDILNDEGEQVGSFLTIAVVDLPPSLPPPHDAPTVADPVLLDLTVSIDGQPDGFIKNVIEIIGTGGSPIVFDNADFHLEELQGKPRLRLRGAWDSGTQVGFDPAWTDIASIEFTLE